MSSNSYANFLAWFYTNNSALQEKNAITSNPTDFVAGPARNAPSGLSVKDINPTMIVRLEDLDKKRLRHVEAKPRKKWYPPRHPVLQEMLYRAQHKQMRRQVCSAIREYFANTKE